MSKSLKYVKDFEFPSSCGFTGSAGSQVVKGYARGGAAKTPAAPKSERKEMARVMRETSSERKGAGAEVKRVSREESYDQAKVSSPAKPARKAYPAHSDVPMIALKKGGMIPSTGKLGVVNNKNPGETAKHTAPDLPKPKTMMKSGGSVNKMARGGAPKAGIANSPKLQAMTQMASQGAALAAQKNATSQQPMPRPGLAVDPAPPRPRGFDNVGSGGIGKDVKGVKGGPRPGQPMPRPSMGGGPGNPTPYDRFMMSPKMQERMKQQTMQRQGINQGDIDRMIKLQMSGDPSFESENAALNARMNANEQQFMQRGQPQVGRMPGNAMTRDQQMQQAQQMQQTNRPADMGMRQQVAQQMAQAQMQAQQQMAQQRPQVPMQQAQPMKKGGMTYKKK